MPLRQVTETSYRAVDPVSGQIENGYLHIFEGRFVGTSRPDPDEVGAWRQMSPGAVVRSFYRLPNLFTPWFGIIVDRLFGTHDGETSHQHEGRLG